MSIRNIKIEHVVRKLELGEYQPEYQGQSIDVWVNPPMTIRKEMENRLFAWQQASLQAMIKTDPKLAAKEYNFKLPEGEDISSLEGMPEEIETAQEAAREAKKQYYAWFAIVWEGDSEEDVLALVAELEAKEPGLWKFLRTETLRMIGGYAAERKKA